MIKLTYKISSTKVLQVNLSSVEHWYEFQQAWNFLYRSHIHLIKHIIAPNYTGIIIIAFLVETINPKLDSIFPSPNTQPLRKFIYQSVNTICYRYPFVSAQVKPSHTNFYFTSVPIPGTSSTPRHLSSSVTFPLSQLYTNPLRYIYINSKKVFCLSESVGLLELKLQQSQPYF